MKIIRYSVNGFAPQYQSYHYNNVLNIINQNIDISKTKLNDYQIQMIKQSIDKKTPFLVEHLTDFQNGIWIFIDGYKNNMSLNHLNRKVPC